jgi:hypothetical protein
MIQQKTALKCQNLQSWKSTHYMVGGHLNPSYLCIFAYFRHLLLPKWIAKKTWKVLAMQQMMIPLNEPKLKSYCVVV